MGCDRPTAGCLAPRSGVLGPLRQVLSIYANYSDDCCAPQAAGSRKAEELAALAAFLDLDIGGCYPPLAKPSEAVAAS